ncbi:MAG: ABC transporter permease [Pseudomonadota bacterium]
MATATSSWDGDGMSLEYTVTKGGKRTLGAIFWAVILFFYSPLIVLFILSLNTGYVPRLPLEGLGLQWYSAALNNETLWSAVGVSLRIATVSAIIATVFALLAAFAIVRGKGAIRIIAAIAAISPLVMPAIVIGVSQLLFFVWIGLPRSPVAVMIGHATFSLPYATLILLPAISQLNPRCDEAAKDLGARAFVRSYTATLPPALPAIVSAFLIAFTLSFDEVAIAGFLIGSDNTFPTYLLAQMRLPQRLPEAMAMSVMAAAFSLILFNVVDRIQQKGGAASHGR